MKPTDVEPALARLLPTYEAEDGTTLYDLPDLPLPPADTPAPVRFLPTWDAVLLVHARRALILPEEHRPKIFHTKMPQSIGTFLVDGAGRRDLAPGRDARALHGPHEGPAQARRRGGGVG